MESSFSILVIDRNPRNQELLGQFLANAGYRTWSAASLEQFDEALAKPGDVALALVDIAGFDHSIWERCERLREGDIPFLIISPKQTAALQQESLAHGARGVLVKPLAAKQLLGIIRSLLGQLSH